MNKQNKGNYEEKLELLLRAKCFFSAEQVLFILISK